MRIVTPAGRSVRTTSPRRVAWQQALDAAVRDPVRLCRMLELPAEWAESPAAVKDFPVLVPQGFIRRIEHGDPADPLLRQVLPLPIEDAPAACFSPDPVVESRAHLTPCMIQKYHGRVLLITTGTCGIHCRFCFRRHRDDAGGLFSATARRETLERIAADNSIEEVILSGGDPLTLPDDRLARLAGELADVGHVKRLRVHTRMPIVVPQRVTGELLTWLRAGRLAPIVVVHTNHPAELDDSAVGALARLTDAGITVLSQSVLLRGVNDDAETLVGLYRRLLEPRVIPYYLHQLDRVAGAAHFEVSQERGRRIIAQLRARLPGYAVPRYVVETPGRPAKQTLA